MEQLTQQELQTLANVVAQTTVRVDQSPPLIELINKMSRMIDQLKRPAPVIASPGTKTDEG